MLLMLQLDAIWHDAMQLGKCISTAFLGPVQQQQHARDAEVGLYNQLYQTWLVPQPWAQSHA